MVLARVISPLLPLISLRVLLDGYWRLCYTRGSRFWLSGRVAFGHLSVGQSGSAVSRAELALIHVFTVCMGTEDCEGRTGNTRNALPSQIKLLGKGIHISHSLISAGWRVAVA